MLKGEIDAALVAHIKWLVIFKNHLSGIERDRLNPDAVRDDTACHFGKWLHANKGTPLFSDQFGHIEPLHAAFHSAAAEVATAINANQNSKEIERQLGELQSLSKQLIAALREIKANL
jgi:hypothetical protein